MKVQLNQLHFFVLRLQGYKPIGSITSLNPLSQLNYF